MKNLNWEERPIMADIRGKKFTAHRIIHYFIKVLLVLIAVIGSDVEANFFRLVT
jgi:hypothetical protein